MRITGINLNLFKARTTETEATKQQNQFVINNTSNPFAGGISSDVFQNSSINDTKTNIFAQKAAELLTSWNKGVETFKTNAKEFFAPAISFAGKVKAGYNKLNEMNIEDLFKGFGKEISMLTLDRDVRKYAKMSVTDLRSELSQELQA